MTWVRNSTIILISWAIISQQSCDVSLQKIIPANEEVYIQKSVYTDMYNLSITTTFPTQ